MSQASDWSDANVPAPDKVGIKDGKTYFFYQIPTSLTGGQVGYLSYQAPEAYNFNVDVDAGSIDGLLDNSFFAGDHLEIEVGVNPMQSYVERIKSVARVRPWLLKKETTGPNAGKYALLSLFVQQLFEPNKPISQEEYLAASDIYAPLDGEIIEVNNVLENDASLINQDAENSGWIFKIKINDKNQFNSLMTSEEYKNFLDK